MHTGLLAHERLPHQGSTPSRSPASIHAHIAAHAAVTPNRPAIVDPTTTLSWAELLRRSGQLADLLRELGAGPEVCVGLLLERSTDFVVAALAVLEAGAAYLPLDPGTPPERAAFILGDAGVPLLLTHRGKASELPPGPWRVLAVDRPEEARAADRPQTPADPDPDSLAYVIYTSGSTGQPKGVEITHANLTNLIDWHRSAFAVTAADRASQVAGLGFDAAVWEIWPHLSAGASLHFADETTRRSAQALRDWLVAERITISFVPTVLAEQMLHLSWPKETALRTLLTGADTLGRRPPAGLPFTLVNNYGPTECTVVSTSGTVPPDADADGPPPIGRPITNAVGLILDAQLRPVLPGEIGELCLAGSLVGRGYRNRPDQTAERFVIYLPDSGPPLRIYRTGDRVRLLPAGDIAFLGRQDEQVKIRGYRIELGEVASCIDRCPGVESCAVVARFGAEGPSLVAYVVAAPDARLTASVLSEFLSTRLPDYMIPTSFVALSALPVTANGKLARAALPAPAADNLLPSRPAGVERSAPAPGGGVQQQIAALVASLLNQPSVGPEENFFLLGGHSMLGAQLVARIKDLFGVRLTLRQLFSASTITALSAEVERLRGGTK